MERATEIGKVTHSLRPISEGFTFIGLMILVAVSGIALGGAGIVWHQSVQREREKELLFIGEEYRQAIGSYFESTPGQVKQYPKKLEDLLLDSRFPYVKRHLRKLYRDPFMPQEFLSLELQQGQIIGVYSKSELEPVKKIGFMPQYAAFGDAKKYDEWKFIYVPGSLPIAIAQPAAAQ